MYCGNFVQNKQGYRLFLVYKLWLKVKTSTLLEMEFGAPGDTGNEQGRLISL